MPRRAASNTDFNDDAAAAPSSKRGASTRRSTFDDTTDYLDSVEALDLDDEFAPRRAGATEKRLRDAARRAAATPRKTTTRLSPPRTASTRDTSEARAAKNSGKSRAQKDAPLLAAPRRTPPRALSFEIGGVLLTGLGALLLFNAFRPAEGFLTVFAVGALSLGFGIGAKILPALMCALGILLVVKRHQLNLRAFSRGALLGFWVLITATHLGVPHGSEFLTPKILYSHGGYVGGASAWLLRRALGEFGAMLFLVVLLIVTVLLWSEVSLAQLATRFFEGAKNLFHGGRDKAQRARRVLAEERDALHEHDAALDADALDSYVVETPPARRTPRQLPREILDDAQRAATRDNAAPKFISVDELLAEAGAEIDAKKRASRASASTRSATFDDETSADGTPRENLAGQPLNGQSLTVQQAAQVLATPGDGTSAAPVATSTANNAAVTPSSIATPTETAPQNQVRIEITDAPPPLSVVAQNDDDEMTPTEKLEAQAIASATDGESAPASTRIVKPRRRFGEGPLMPEYFDDAVRALDPPLVADVTGVEEDVHEGVRAVTDTLSSFKIDARVTDVKRGPVITRYEVQPAPGVRVASIANLDRDMARALSALSVRIEAPVPGKDVVGIEVPNKKVHLVRLRDVLERNDFLSAPSQLAFVLGKDIAGNPKWGDLTKMPHMLIAGATNSGKSVCLNSIIASILVRATPEDVKFSLIDPKRVELTLYKGIRHLLHDVVVEPKDAVRALRAAIAEMDRRYKRFAERGVRNIASYNAKLEEGEAKLPYIVIVIDELADLMMTAAAEFEKLICRIAQLARATGIHLIVATQRPSVNVITGVIKANIPSRIAFAVASQVDSRTILDSVGAERLIGSGDMLFDANNGGKATRIQGAFLSEEEVNRVVEVVKAHYAGDPSPFAFEMDLSGSDGDDEDDTASTRSGNSDDKRDSLYDEILEFVRTKPEMSASMIQRKFEIGFPRAGRIVDQLERDGVLSAADGPRPRKVIGAGS